MLLYTLNWSREKCKQKSNINRIYVNIQGVTAEGRSVVIRKLYDEWTGVLTNDILKVIRLIRKFFPGVKLKYKQLNISQYKKVLPNLKDRLLKKNKLLYNSKNFYKLYSSNAYINDIGIVMDKYKISYYKPDDWLTRIYIDLCTANNTNSFFYMWYYVSDSEMLLSSMKINMDFKENPAIQIAAFDLETVPLDGENRIPTGHDENDRIVMASILKWDYTNDNAVEKFILYLNPTVDKLNEKLVKQPGTIYMEFFEESDLIKKFHSLVKDSHIITGYNINNFDLPCLLARIVLLNIKSVLKLYSSKKIGTYIIPTFQDKMIIDIYHFMQIFCKYGLSSFKLDVVAKCKLNKSKYPIKPITIHNYYNKKIDADLLLREDKNSAFDAIEPKNVELSEFGTFSECLEYCLEDSVLVYELFKKELALTFLIERANFTAITIEQALHLGNSKYILEVLKTYGTCMGYFLNLAFFTNTVEKDLEYYKDYLVIKNNTFQGALNYAVPGSHYKNVSSVDFLSMYPSIFINENISPDTFAVLSQDEFLTLPKDLTAQCQCVPYRNHSEDDILVENKFPHDSFKLPSLSLSDKMVMVSYKNELGFLPNIVNFFLEKRKKIQSLYSETRDSTLYTRQLNIKLFLNSIYGCMASHECQIAYVEIAMGVTCFARIYILAVCEYTRQVLGCQIAYCDTDGIFVVDYPFRDCNLINQYLNQKFMILQFDKVMTNILIISKKRYVYEENNEYKMTGFEKKGNALTKYMSNTIISEVLSALKSNEADVSKGWLIWVNTLIRAFVMCKNPRKHCITRKTKLLHEYKSKTCPQLKILKKNPLKAGEFIDFTYSQTDILLSESNKWIMEVDECQEVNFEKLFINKKKIFINLLNIAFFKFKNPEKHLNKVLNTMRWKSILLADLMAFHGGRPILLLVLKSGKYTFDLNN